jgi:hypothetical protein
MRIAGFASYARGLLKANAPRAVALVLLLSVAAVLESVNLASLRDPEIWRHLRMGSWILENRNWPHSGLFSQAARSPWRDLSWGYDVLVVAAYRLVGLRAVPGLLMCFRVAFAAIPFLLAGGPRNFWSAVTLSAIAQVVLAGMGPDTICLSIIFFGIELLLLLEAQKSGNVRALYVLPVLFFLWSNLDIGFIYGITLYVLFLIALAVEQLGGGANWRGLQPPPTRISLGAAVLMGMASVATSFLNPYGYHAYADFLASQTSGVNEYLPGYASMTFHKPQDYALMLLAMAAFLRLGVKRVHDLFQISVLIACTALAFHAQRDNWLVALAAVALIGETMRQGSELQLESELPRWRNPTLTPVAACIAIVFLAFTLQVPREREVLLAKIAEQYPVRASDYIRQHQLPMPLFNLYAWGSFLTWYLPEYPVAIDSRRGLYPEEEEVGYFKAMKADLPYQAFPPMKLARTLLFDKIGVMGDALKDVAGFRVAYEDDISIVLLQERKE